MSLFNVCPWWSTQCPDTSASYDSASLLCTRLGTSEQSKDFVIVGSHTGYLSIFKPCARSDEEHGGGGGGGTVWGFRATDLLLEIKMHSPVIALETGKFSAVAKQENRIQLAVLQPMTLNIYNVLTDAGITEHGEQSRLQLVYEWPLQQFAYSLCKGNFGGVKDREFLCVMHMDSSLRFFEQDGISFECTLPGERPIPAPFRYVARTDSFVTVSSAWDAECFRYQDLAQENNPSEASNRIAPIWSVCVGEEPLNLAVHQLTNAESVVIILGEHHLFCLTDTGKVRFIKRLDYAPLSFCSFVIGYYWEANARLMIAIASESHTFLIYESTKMVWAAQLADKTVAVARGNFDGLTGGIVHLSDTGLLTVGFLGSTPVPFKASLPQLQPLNFDKAQQELNELEKAIRNGIDFTDAAVINASAERDLVVQVIGAKVVQRCTFTDAIGGKGDTQMVNVSVVIIPRLNLNEAQVTVAVEPPLKASLTTLMFHNLIANAKQRMDTSVYVAQADVDVPSLECRLLVSYVAKDNVMRIIERTVDLPMALIACAAVAQKEASAKITFATSQRMPNLDTLFPDIRFETNGQAIAFEMLGTGANVTAVVAKNANRYRIQSNSVTALAVIVSAIVSRFAQLYEKTGETPTAATATATSSENKTRRQVVVMEPHLPATAIADTMAAHLSAVQCVAAISEELSAKCTQFRLVQRRLLVKIEDKSPGALNGINTLLQTTHAELVNIAARLKLAKAELKRTQTNLSCALKLITIVLQHLDLPAHYTDTLCAVLTSPANDWTEQCWETTIFPVLEHLASVGPLRSGGHEAHAPVDVSAPTVASTAARVPTLVVALVERALKMAAGRRVEAPGEAFTLSQSQLQPLSPITGDNIAIAVPIQQTITDVDPAPQDETSDWITTSTAGNDAEAILNMVLEMSGLKDD